MDNQEINKKSAEAIKKIRKEITENIDDLNEKRAASIMRCQEDDFTKDEMFGDKIKDYIKNISMIMRGSANNAVASIEKLSLGYYPLVYQNKILDFKVKLKGLANILFGLEQMYSLRPNVFKPKAYKSNFLDVLKRIDELDRMWNEIGGLLENKEIELAPRKSWFSKILNGF